MRRTIGTAKSLTIKEDLGDRPGQASTSHQLGMTALERGRPDEAEDWYPQVPRNHRRTGDLLGVASTYHQLGMAALDGGRLDEAEEWYRRSLAIGENAGDVIKA